MSRLAEETGPPAFPPRILAGMGEQVLIRRSNRGSVVGDVEDLGDVYITGPHFGAAEVYSSTKKVAEASRFEEHEARRLLRLGTWPNQRARVVLIEEAEDLPLVSPRSRGDRRERAIVDKTRLAGRRSAYGRRVDH